MANEHIIGAADLKVGLDATGFDAGVNSILKKQNEIGANSVKQGDRMTQAQKRTNQSLERQIAIMGMTRDEVTKYNILTRTTGEIQAKLLAQHEARIKKLKEEKDAYDEANKAQGKYGIGLKQYNAAVRQVPAQITDIGVSLAGGQNPMMVLLQQGGQLKDVFGSAKAAAAALGAEIAKMVTSPFVLMAAVAGTAAVAIWQQVDSVTKLDKAIAQAGNTAGTTTPQLQKMANALAESTDWKTSIGDATTAFATIVASGKIAEDQYALVARAAVDAQAATGAAVEDTVAQFAKLADDPVKAVVELNKQTGFLTIEVYNQVKALQQAGDAHGAAVIAENAYADALKKRANDVRASQSFIAKGWNEVWASAKQAWEMTSQVLLTAAPAKAQLYQLQKQLEDMDKTKGPMERFFSGLTGPGESKQRALLKKQIADLEDQVKQQTQAEKQAQADAVKQRITNYAVSLDQLASGTKNADEKRAAEIKRSRAETNRKIVEAEKAGLTSLATQLKKAQADYEKGLNDQAKKPKSAKSGLGNATARADLSEYTAEATKQLAVIQGQTKILQSEWQARKISEGDYYSRSRELILENTKVQEKSITDQIAYLKARDVKGVDAQNVTRQITALEGKLAKVREDGAAAIAVLGNQEEGAAKKRTDAITAYTNSLRESESASKADWDAQVARISMGEKEAQKQEAVAKIMQKTAQEKRRLAEQLASTGDQALYDQELAALENSMPTQVQIVRDGYAAMEDAQGNWLNGLSKGTADWMTQASDVASQVASITGQTLNGFADSLTSFATTGKANIKEMLVDVLKSISKFMMQQAVLKFAQMFIGAASDGDSGGGGNTGWYSDWGQGWGGNGGWSGFQPHAKGGVIPHTGNISDYSGKVVSQPTPFFFAKGAGIMGEAGAEAIMPLSRDASGKLGVKAMGGGSSGDIQVNTQINVAPGESSTTTSTAGENASSYRAFADQMASVSKKTLEEALRPGGTLWNAGVRR